MPPLLTVAVVAGGVAALTTPPAVGTGQRTVDYVVIAGVPGLRWEDVNPQDTPNLWRMAERGSIGSLSVRSARRPTCPMDGWLTLGAGNYAASGAPPVGGCPPTEVVVEQPDGIGGYLPEQRATVRHNQEKHSWGAVPGALAESVRCTVAVGTGAAVAAARPFGRVDRYEPELPLDADELLASCVLSMVDLGAVVGVDTARRATVRRADALLARVLAARPERSLVIVAGLSDTDQSSRLHVAVADGPGWDGGWITSPTTARDGYLQAVDLAPTALSALGRALPDRLFIGQAATSVAGRPADLAAAIAYPADADREARAQRWVAGWFFALLAGFQTALAVAAIPLLRRARRPAHPTGPTPVGRRVVQLVEVLLIAAALAIPAALVADVVPWWRGGRAAVLVFAAVTVAALTLATAVVRFSRPYPRTLGPMAVVALLAVTVVGADVLTGARLQLNGVTGYSASDGGRYAGLGTVGLGVLIAGTLLAAGCLAQRVRRSWRPMVIVTIGGAGVILVGSPYVGADPVGAIALTAGVSIAAAISTGGWLTLARLAWATMAGLAVTAGFAALDLRRPAAERGSLGRFLSALADGTGGLTLHRSSSANLSALTDSPLTVVAVVSVVLVWFALLQPWGGLKRLFGIYPVLRAGMAGIAVASAIGGGLGGNALDVAGAAAAVTVPMAVLAARRVLEHAADRTRPTIPAESSGAVTADPSGPTVPVIEPDADPEVTRPAVSAGVTVESRGSRQQHDQ